MQNRISAFLEVPYSDIYPISYDVSQLVCVQSTVAKGVIRERRSDISDANAADFIVQRIRRDLEKKGYIPENEKRA
jgi:hypothetical protein